MAKDNLSNARQAKLDKAWNKQYRFGSLGVLSVREFLNNLDNVILGKEIFKQEYASKKVNGQYKKLDKPKLTYGVHYRSLSENEVFILDIPKIVFDDCMFVDITDSPEEVKRAIKAN